MLYIIKYAYIYLNLSIPIIQRLNHGKKKRTERKKKKKRDWRGYQWFGAFAALAENPAPTPGSSQPSVTPTLGNLTSSSRFRGHCTHMVHLHMCRQNTYVKYLLKKRKGIYLMFALI